MPKECRLSCLSQRASSSPQYTTHLKAAVVAPSAISPTIPPTTTPFTVAASSASDPPMTPAILEAVVRFAAAVVTPATALLAIAAPSSKAASMEIAAEGMPPTVIMPCTTVPVATGLPSIAPNGGRKRLTRDRFAWSVLGVDRGPGEAASQLAFHSC